MALPSSSTQFAALSLGLAFIPVTEKLTRSNYQSWQAQVLSAIRGVQAADFIKSSAKPPSEFLPPKTADNKEPPVANPEYAVWVAKDQQVSATC